MKDIKKSKTKTLIMIAHIDIAMESLKNKQHKVCSPEKYEALRMFYIEEMTQKSFKVVIVILSTSINQPFTCQSTWLTSGAFCLVPS